MATKTTMDEFLKECEQLQLVRWVFCDINGNSRTKLIPGKMCRAFVKRGGRDLCSAVYSLACNSFAPDVDWITANGYPDCSVMPDPSTYHIVTWSQCNAKIGQVICSSNWSSGLSVPFDPRNVAQRQVAQLQEMGLAVFSAFEPEWRLFIKDNSGADYTWSEEAIDPYSSAIAHKYEQLLCDICSALGSAGLTVEAVHTEFGRGQMEITMVPSWGLRAPDEAFLYREIVKQVACNHNCIASFMSTPYSDEAGSGLHFNHSIWSSNHNSNAFHDASEESGMSQLMQKWIAGLVTHSAAIVALTSPTLNCYRRLHKPFTPAFADWEKWSRNATYRVKVGQSSQSGTYVENRAPSSAANPYIVFAATLAAGIDGIRRDLQLTPAATRDAASELPRTMQQSLEALAADSVICDAMGEQLVEFYAEVKKQFDMAVVGAGVQGVGVEVEDQLRVERKFYLEYH